MLRSAFSALRSPLYALRSALYAVCFALCALALWALSLEQIDVRQMTDLGLVSVLPLGVYMALALLIVSFGLALKQQRLVPPVLLAHVVVLIVILYGTTTLVEEVPRFAVTWRHVGFTEYIMRTGGVDGNLDAYFNWPGFFALSAFATQIAGFSGAISLTAWASVIFNLLYVGPLLLILRSATDDQRLVWLSVWFFYLSNWVAQDYFAPQAMNYFFHLVIVAVLLTWFKRTAPVPATALIWLKRLVPWGWARQHIAQWLQPASQPNALSRPWQRMWLLGLILTLYVVVAASHQLTPFFTLGVVAGLVVLGRVSPRTLPILMVIIVGTWISFMTVAFLSGHLNMITEGLGKVSSNVGQSVTKRLQGSPEHVFVVRMRVVMTLAIWGIALVGALRRMRQGYYDLSFVVLAVTPFVFVAVQSYGGELLLRSYLFALPGLVFFAAAAFLPKQRHGMRWRTVGGTMLASAALLCGFLFARYGNERMDYFTAGEVEAVRHVYTEAQAGTRLVTGAWNLPWKYEAYDKYVYTEQVPPEILETTDVAALVQLLTSDDYPATYFIVTRSQIAAVDLFSGLPADALGRLERALKASDKVKVVYSNPDATIFTLATGTTATQ